MTLILQFPSRKILEELCVLEYNKYKINYKYLLGTNSNTIINNEWLKKYLGISIDCVWIVEIDKEDLVQVKLDKVVDKDLLLKNLESRLKEFIKIFISIENTELISTK